MQTASPIQKLNDRFAIPGIARILAAKGGLPCVRVTSPVAAGEVYLHGAHLTSWVPAGTDEVIFLSEHSKFEEGKAIRGGVPICFPWFRAKADEPKAPAHGFVRTRAWELESVIHEADGIAITMSIESDEATRKFWPFDFRAEHRITIGAALKLEFTVTNMGNTAFRFEEALHTYHRVGDVRNLQISGLDGVAFLDNTDGNRERVQQGDIVFSGPTDNAYLNTRHGLTIIDPQLRRKISIEKENSLTTVVWNPWHGAARTMADLGDEEWRQMACAEASNILDFAVPLQPGKRHTLTAVLHVAPLEP